MREIESAEIGVALSFASMCTDFIQPHITLLKNKKTRVHVFVLAGQSNMVGRGSSSDIPNDIITITKVARDLIRELLQYF
jgi:hypothetical protein